MGAGAQAAEPSNGARSHLLNVGGSQFMNSDSTWYAVLRLVWLTGGVVAINESGAKVQINTGINGKLIETFEITDYGASLQPYEQEVLRFWGTTFVIDGRELPDFRVSNPQRGWLIWELKQRWREIAAAASKSDIHLMSIASRLASRLQYSHMRLHDLASPYSVSISIRRSPSQCSAI